MKKHSFIWVILGLFIFANCTTTKVVSRKMTTEDTSDMQSILYAVYMDQKMEKTLPYLTETSSALYTKNGIKFDLQRFSFFDNPENYTVEYLTDASSKEGFEYFLMLNEISYDKDIHDDGWDDDDIFPSKTITHGLEAFLYSSNGSQIWRAQIEVESSDFGNSKQTGNSLAKKLISKLKKDQVLSGNFKTK